MIFDAALSRAANRPPNIFSIPQSVPSPWARRDRPAWFDGASQIKSQIKINSSLLQGLNNQ